MVSQNPSWHAKNLWSRKECRCCTVIVPFQKRWRKKPVMEFIKEICSWRKTKPIEAFQKSKSASIAKAFLWKYPTQPFSFLSTSLVLPSYSSFSPFNLFVPPSISSTTSLILSSLLQFLVTKIFSTLLILFLQMLFLYAVPSNFFLIFVIVLLFHVRLLLLLFHFPLVTLLILADLM